MKEQSTKPKQPKQPKQKGKSKAVSSNKRAPTTLGETAPYPLVTPTTPFDPMPPSSSSSHPHIAPDSIPSASSAERNPLQTPYLLADMPGALTPGTDALRVAGPPFRPSDDQIAAILVAQYNASVPESESISIPSLPTPPWNMLGILPPLPQTPANANYAQHVQDTGMMQQQRSQGLNNWQAHTTYPGSRDVPGAGHFVPSFGRPMQSFHTIGVDSLPEIDLRLQALATSQSMNRGSTLFGMPPCTDDAPAQAAGQLDYAAPSPMNMGALCSGGYASSEGFAMPQLPVGPYSAAPSPAHSRTSSVSNDVHSGMPSYGNFAMAQVANGATSIPPSPAYSQTSSMASDDIYASGVVNLGFVAPQSTANGQHASSGGFAIPQLPDIFSTTPSRSHSRRPSVSSNERPSGMPSYGNIAGPYYVNNAASIPPSPAYSQASSMSSEDMYTDGLVSVGFGMPQGTAHGRLAAPGVHSRTSSVSSNDHYYSRPTSSFGPLSNPRPRIYVHSATPSPASSRPSTVASTALSTPSTNYSLLSTGTPSTPSTNYSVISSAMPSTPSTNYSQLSSAMPSMPATHYASAPPAPAAAQPDAFVPRALDTATAFPFRGEDVCDARLSGRARRGRARRGQAAVPRVVPPVAVPMRARSETQREPEVAVGGKPETGQVAVWPADVLEEYRDSSLKDALKGL